MSGEKIFISYRRSDASGFAGRLFDRLSSCFGEEHIFMDVDTIDPGVDFVEVLERAVSTCDVLIALIGQGWLNATDEEGSRRLDDPDDFVGIEVATALNRDTRVIPVLVQGARMPASRALPDKLKRLARLNAYELRHERFNSDADRLCTAIEDYFNDDSELHKRETTEKETPEQAERETQITAWLKSAETALEKEEWQSALNNYRHVLELSPDHREAQEGYQIASDNLELAILYGQAIMQRADGHLARALQNLSQIQKKDPDYRDVPALIGAVEAQISEKTRSAGTPEDDDTSISEQSEIETVQNPTAYDAVIKSQIAKPTQAKDRETKALKQPLLVSLSALPRGLWYLGGGVGVVLILVLAIWGGGKLLGAQRDSESPTETKAVALLLVETDTPEATQTVALLPIETDTPEATQTDSNELPQLIIDDYGVSMALIPAGSFQMGSDADDGLTECQKVRTDCKRRWFEDEEQVHTVTLDDFYIDQYEVTNTQFVAFLNDQGNQSEGSIPWLAVSDEDARIELKGGIWQADAGYADHPVVEVSWYGAQAYCQWRGVRLPSEAEWEKAARGGLENALYPWGDEFAETLANFCDINCEYDHANPDFNDGYAYTAPVGTYPQNGYKLYDMAGNVWEWTADWYDVYPGGDPGISNFFGEQSRVIRGGSWHKYRDDLRVANRDYSNPSVTSIALGFRCASSK